MPDTHEEIVELERKYWQAMVDRDLDAALQMTADPCLIAGASGVAVVDHAKYRQIFEGAKWELLEYALDNIQTHAVTDDVILIAYTITENLVVEGKPVTLKASDTSTWVRRDGRWVNAMHTEAVLGDSYGRDRKPAPRKTASTRRVSARSAGRSSR